MAVANALAPPFSILNDGCSNQSVPPAGSCTFDVRFQPTGNGTFNDSLDIPTNNDPDDPFETVTVSGTGTTITPDISITDTVAPVGDQQVPFGNLTEGTTLDRTVTVTNNGSANLVLGTVGGVNPLAAPFSFTTDNCSLQTLAPAASCSIQIRFSPVTLGFSSDSLNIPSNDPDEATVICRRQRYRYCRRRRRRGQRPAPTAQTAASWQSIPPPCCCSVRPASGAGGGVSPAERRDARRGHAVRGHL